jgi:hypothetical protein
MGVNAEESNAANGPLCFMGAEHSFITGAQRARMQRYGIFRGTALQAVGGTA